MKDTKNITVLGKVKSYTLEEVQISRILRGKHCNLSNLFLEAERERLKDKNKKQKNKPFAITATSLVEDTSHFSEKELFADSEVNYVAIPFCDKKLAVFYRENYIDLAKQRGEKTLLVRKFTTQLSEEEIFAIQIRYSSKEAPLDNMARMESIRYAIDNFNWTPAMLNSLMVKAKGTSWSTTEISKEYLVGKLYEEFCDHEINFTKEKLTKRSFSFLKALMRNSQVKNEIIKSKDKREHFVNIAINAAGNSKIGRLEDHITKILKHEDTKETFFTKGFLPAIEELKVKYPDSDKTSFPEFDLQNAKKKLEISTVKSFIQKQITRNPTSCKSFNALMDCIWLIIDENTTSQRMIIEMLTEVNPSLVSSILIEKGHDVSISQKRLS
jgi:hypothetical protein